MLSMFTPRFAGGCRTRRTQSTLIIPRLYSWPVQGFLLVDILVTHSRPIRSMISHGKWLVDAEKIKVNGKDCPIYYGKIIQMFQTTNQMIYRLWFFRICLNSVRGGDPCGCPCRQPSCHMVCWTWEVRRGMTFWVGTAPIDDNLTGTMDDNCGLSPIFLGQYCRFSPLSQFWLLQLMTILLGLSGASLQLIVFCPLSRYQTQHFFFVLLH